MLDISTFKSEAAVCEAAGQQYEAEHPRLVKPTRPETARPQIVQVGTSDGYAKKSRLWLEVDQPGSYTRHGGDPVIHLCQQSPTDSAEISIEELLALRVELDRAGQDYAALKIYKAQYNEYQKDEQNWNDAKRDAEGAAISLWRKRKTVREKKTDGTDEAATK